MTDPGRIIADLRRRGGAVVDVEGELREVRVMMLRDPDDPRRETPTLTLDDVEALLTAAQADPRTAPS